MDDDRYSDHREFERHSLDFSIEVSPVGDASFCDLTVLENISGGGVCFSTRIADHYAIGMDVSLKVFLPSIETDRVSMDSVARVVWIHHLNENSGENAALIGLCLEGFMSFEGYHPSATDAG